MGAVHGGREHWGLAGQPVPPGCCRSSRDRHPSASGARASLGRAEVRGHCGHIWRRPAWGQVSPRPTAPLVSALWGLEMWLLVLTGRSEPSAREGPPATPLSSVLPVPPSSLLFLLKLCSDPKEAGQINVFIGSSQNIFFGFHFSVWRSQAGSVSCLS